MCFYFLRMRTIFTFEVPQRALGAARRRIPSPWHGPILFSYFHSMQPCSFLHKVSSRDSCSMGLAVGYDRGYSSSADPMSVDLAVELGEGQS